MSSEEGIKVAVRVRPFNDRERARKAVNVIEIPDGKRTGILDPANMKAEPKYFAFDHSYWSHDGFVERDDGYLQPNSSNYADQARVFNDLGRGVLQNAWNGYNCSLFAYGQTGSGKSYSMVGYGENKGIVPIACEELFKEIEAKAGDGKEYQVTVSMFEIYCEKVRDLLSDKPPPKGGLKVREHPKKGFYVENLRAAPVKDYKSIEAKIDEGTRNRTVAATNMNATSSRAHTLVQLTFAQNTPGAGGKGTTKTSLINLVDLAGSERHSDAGTEGDRLKEGIVINQSLSTLGRVIKSLHEQQSAKGKAKKGAAGQVPYRDSVLTSLLKNALGGNSKTIMIAALSPADINYEETLSTLRFADRAKSIKTKAVVNESATDRLIRELKEENQRLMSMMTGGATVAAASSASADGGSGQHEELDVLKQQLEANRKEMELMEQSWQQRLAQEAKRDVVGAKAETDERRKTTPHFWNLNEDPALSDMIVHFAPSGETTVGNKQAQPPAEIQLNGLSIHPHHAKIVNKDNKKLSLEALQGATILVNGKPITKPHSLSHNDRIMFGGNHLYVFAHPSKMSKKKKHQEVTYEIAQSEITANSGIMQSMEGSHSQGVKSKEDMILEEELIQMMPQVYRANAMAEELKKQSRFEIILVAPQARGLKSGTTDIYVKMTLKSMEFLWDKGKFVNRYYGMQEMYQNYIEGYNDWNVQKDHDPFYESPDSEVLIGGVHVYLQSLAYMVELDEQLPITDFKGVEHGQLMVALVPCSPQGKEITGEFVDSPEDLIGKNLGFKVKIKSAMGLHRKFTSTRCKYKFYLEEKDSCSLEIAGGNPNYGHEKTFTFKPVTQQLVDYLKDSALYIEVLGKQGGDGASRSRQMPAYNARGGSAEETQRAIELQSKLDEVQHLLAKAKEKGGGKVSVKDMQRILGDAGLDSAEVEAHEKKKKKKRTPSKTNNKQRDSAGAKSTGSADSGLGNGGEKKEKKRKSKSKSRSQK